MGKWAIWAVKDAALTELMARRKLSTKKLAELAGVNAATVAKMCRGGTVRNSIAYRVADALKVDVGTIAKNTRQGVGRPPSKADWPRLAVTFSPENHAFVTLFAKKRQKTVADIINKLIADERARHPKMEEVLKFYMEME